MFVFNRSLFTSNRPYISDQVVHSLTAAFFTWCYFSPLTFQNDILTPLCQMFLTNIQPNSFKDKCSISISAQTGKSPFYYWLLDDMQDWGSAAIPFRGIDPQICSFHRPMRSNRAVTWWRRSDSSYTKQLLLFTQTWTATSNQGWNLCHIPFPERRSICE